MYDQSILCCIVFCIECTVCCTAPFAKHCVCCILYSFTYRVPCIAQIHKTQHRKENTVRPVGSLQPPNGMNLFRNHPTLPGTILLFSPKASAAQLQACSSWLVPGPVSPAQGSPGQPVPHRSAPQACPPLPTPSAPTSQGSAPRPACTARCSLTTVAPKPLLPHGVTTWCCSLHQPRVTPYPGRTPTHAARGSAESCPWGGTTPGTSTHGGLPSGEEPGSGDHAAAFQPALVLPALLLLCGERAWHGQMLGRWMLGS